MRHSVLLIHADKLHDVIDEMTDERGRVALIVESDYDPGQPKTHYQPGYPEQFEITKVEYSDSKPFDELLIRALKEEQLQKIADDEVEVSR